MHNPIRTFVTASAVMFVALTWTALQAQPVLTVNRVINNWPSIEVYYTVQCNGQPDYTIDKSHFTVKENGADVNSFTMWCPNPQTHCAASVALVLQASAGTAGDKHTQIIAGAKDFVGHFDGVTDEASLIWAHDIGKIPMMISTDKSLLSQEIDNLPATGISTLWDGIYLGVQEVILSGSNACRSVVVFSDGTDEGSTYSQTEIIALANRNRVKIYTVGIDVADATVLQAIASQTGGLYFDSPEGSNMLALYQNLTTFLFEQPLECIITYQNSCADGSERTIELTLDNYCGGSDSYTATYRAPQDVLRLTLDKAAMSLGETQSVAITAHSSEPRDVGPATFRIEYEEDLIESIVLKKEGTALANTLTTESFANGVMEVSLDQSVQVLGYETFVELVVTTKASSSVHNSPLRLIDWNNDVDPTCWKIVSEDGRVTVTGTTGLGAHRTAIANNFAVTPNPNNGTFQVALDFAAPTAFSTRIINALGQTVYERHVPGKRLSYREQIQLPNAPAGVYFLLLESGTMYDFRKVIIR